MVEQAQKRDPGQSREAILWWLVIVGLGGLTLARIASNLRGLPGVWDDAFMFVRYADNLMHTGRLSWNPGGEATYGLTSLLYLAVVVPVRWFTSNPVTAAAFSSYLPGVAFLVLLVVMLEKHGEGGPIFRHGYTAFSLGLLAATVPQIGTHCGSGMDTTFALCFVTAYLILAQRFDARNTAASAILLGILGGFAFWVRPDLMVYTYTVPAALAVFSPTRDRRRLAALALAITVTVTGAQLLASYLYFDSPLPLPFYNKGLNRYGAYFLGKYSNRSLKELVYYVITFFPFFLLIASYLALGLRDRMRSIPALDRGLLLATALFIGYYLFFVVPIMAYSQRLYFPTFPALAYLGQRSAATLLAQARRRYPNLALDRSLRHTFMGIALGAILVLSPATYTRLTGNDYMKDFDLYGEYWKHEGQYMLFFLAEFSQLPDELVIATTEVGFPAAMNPRKQIVDLAGLNETRLAHQGFSAAYVLTRYRPDLIYMPHPHYRQMLSELSADPIFRKDYERFPMPAPEERGMDLAIRRSSPFYERMRRIILTGLPAARAHQPAPALSSSFYERMRRIILTSLPAACAQQPAPALRGSGPESDPQR
jgi:hypothetical protein